MDLTIYEKDRGFVLSKLQQGEFDYIDTADEVFEADFFRFIGARGMLNALAETYPTPRKKTEVPVWLVLGSEVSMRLHGAEAYNQYRYVIRTGGFLTAFGSQLGGKTVDEATGNVKLECQGFNGKNMLPRQTPCDADFLRKFSRSTDAAKVEHWYNTDVARLWKTRHAYDPQGVFIGDATYVFVPDNPAYEHSVRLLFDKHNHPVDSRKVDARDLRAGKYQWHRCYKLVTLMHVYPRGEGFLMVGFRLLPGNASELPAMYELLDTFIGAVGDGVVRRLILDRGFLDGARIGHLKIAHGVDVLIPIKRSMDLYADAMGLIKHVRFAPYVRPPVETFETGAAQPAPPTSEVIQKREAKRQRTLAARRKQAEAKVPPVPADEQMLIEEVGVLRGFTSWSSCPVPLSVVYSRESYADGHQETWLLLDTAPVEDAAHARGEYAIRIQIEERYRQLKCFGDLTSFTSRSFSLVMTQILTVLLTFSLLQFFLKRTQRSELNNKPFPFMRKQLLPAASYVVVYCENKVAFFHALVYTQILLELDGAARAKALARTRRLRKDAFLLEHAQGP